MERTKIFISSTCFDLSQIRKDLKEGIEAMGHIPILSESKDFPVNPSLNSVENCIEAVRSNADILVLIIGGRYGFAVDSGKSITNSEFLTALDKGIPIYTFTKRDIISVLPVWEKNRQADFSDVVNDNKVFEFVKEVREKTAIWNFEFESAQDILEILKLQLSFLFGQALVSHQRIQSIDRSLVTKISSKALKILLDKKDNYEMLTFMQMMQDEIDRYKYLNNDCKHSIIIKPGPYISEPVSFTNWQQEKMHQLEKNLSSLNQLFDAFEYYYGEPGVASDIDGLYYVAHRYGELYGSLLEWVIDIRSTNTEDIYTSITQVLSNLPGKAIAQLEAFPGDSIAAIHQSIEDLKSGKIEVGSTVQLSLKLSIDDSVMEQFRIEMDKLHKALVR